jgi:hypothetical protein
MMNSLVSSSSWQPPAIYLYGAAFAALLSMVAYTLVISRSGFETGVTLMVLAALGVAYSSAWVFALASGVPLGSLVFHPHHYMIAWHCCLLFRQSADLPSIVVRWILMGVMLQGLTAYSAASMLSN